MGEKQGKARETTCGRWRAGGRLQGLSEGPGSSAGVGGSFRVCLSLFCLTSLLEHNCFATVC